MAKYFRVLGFVECASLLVLLLIAMPLKYFMGIPEAVRVVGSIHGVLFLIFVFMSISVGIERRWSGLRIISTWLIASIPLGPIIFDKKLMAQ